MVIHTIQHIPLLICVLACIWGISISCGNDDTVSGPSTLPPDESEYATLKLYTVDENSDPVMGIRFTVHYQNINVIGNQKVLIPDTTYIAYSDNYGVVAFGSIIPGSILIRNDPELHDPSYFISMTLEAGKSYMDTLFFPSGPVPITVKATEKKDGEYRPLNNATVRIASYYGKEITQPVTIHDGTATIQNIDPMIFSTVSIPYRAIIERDNLAAIIRHAWTEKYLYYENGSWILNLELNEQPFESCVLFPEPNTTVNGPAVSFSCTGYDFEDGELPDEAFSWNSDRDGELGVGRNIDATLSPGLHKITVISTDSCGLQALYLMHINVSYPATGTYFPLPVDGYWKYRIDPVTFSIENEWGEMELWSLADMTVTSGGNELRTCTMNWEISCNGSLKRSCYKLTDNISLDGNQVSVSATEEQLIVFDGPNALDVPVLELRTTTYYTPGYPLITDYTEPAAELRSQTTITAKSSIVQTVTGAGLYTRNTTQTLDVDYSSGPETSVMTPLGTFETIPVTLQTGDVLKTWYLAPNIGIVKFDTSLMTAPISARLYETNLDIPQNTARSTGFIEIGTHSDIDIAVNSEQRYETLREIMRGLSPF